MFFSFWFGLGGFVLFSLSTTTSFVIVVRSFEPPHLLLPPLFPPLPSLRPPLAIAITQKDYDRKLCFNYCINTFSLNFECGCRCRSQFIFSGIFSTTTQIRFFSTSRHFYTYFHINVVDFTFESMPSRLYSILHLPSYSVRTEQQQQQQNRFGLFHK